MEKIKEIIVVEGKDDTKRLALAVDADTIETRGSAISPDILEQIALAQETRGVIVFTDPDGPGEKIRKIISMNVPGVKHAFITKDQGRHRKSVKASLGIEHASVEDIREALDQVVEERIDAEETVSQSFLIKEGLIGSDKARALREALGEELRIGYTNGKQLKKRLTMFGFSEEDVKEALAKIRKEQADNDA
ncbi:ribonuclease M5 [Alkalibacterium putridalgicola]|uniref:Ribonuclease M5 n=1 Tax=Alkalibacterium putridalgicola TaxID=426703 RepID=A0A1H7U0J3_9LACT|nr:ribonuclease M5 [Alkalibacterium putridalgicola]GEK89516.1 ribonuclease M5 [Alkalibacterium putridalgicola]SEL90501.1 ribonuclease M5 [Alkalibacterium putridalgicola]